MLATSGARAAFPCTTPCVGDTLRMSDLANRLRRWSRHLRKWAKREQVACYRVYDHDLPDQPLVVDWYAGEAVVWLHSRTRDDTPEAAAEWEASALAAVADGLAIEPQAVIAKHRGRQSDRQHGGQYQRLGEGGATRMVSEAGLRFEVNLHDYLDTGLFLDHRQTRAMVAAEAAGKRVLNLFAYTGAFSVHAAAAGAASTRSLDLSATYCQWARRNLEHNGINDRDRHRITRCDVLAWLDQSASETYDLIVCDPPTFSNSKRMQHDWVVGRDHAWLLDRCQERLATGGSLWFSTNDRRFELDATIADDWQAIDELTSHTVPPDFERRRPHRCWKLTM